MTQENQSFPLRVGLIGGGRYGQFVASALHASRLTSLIAVADKQGTSANIDPKIFDLATIHVDPKNIFDDPNIDAVHIATPPDTHKDLALAAIKAGKHIVVEKPLALTPEDGKQILAAADKTQRIVGMGYIMRYNPIVNTLRQILKDGLFGSLRAIRLENIAQHVEPPTHWFWDIKQSGGIHIEHGVHFFDTASYILDLQPQQVEGGLILREKQNTDAFAMAIYPHQITADFFHSFLTLPELEQTRWLFIWDKAKAVIEGWIPLRLTIYGNMTPEEISRCQQLNMSLEQLNKNSSKATLALTNGKQAVYADSIRALWEDMAKAIHQKDNSVCANGQTGLDSLTSAYQASQRQINL